MAGQTSALPTTQNLVAEENAHGDTSPMWKRLVGSIRNTIFAVLSSVGLLGTVLLYAEARRGATVSSTLRWVIALAMGIIALHASIALLNRVTIRNWKSMWQVVDGRIPLWGRCCIYVLWSVALFHMTLFIVRTGGSVPVVEDGECVLTSRGRIMQVLSVEEFRALKAFELMVLTSIFAASYATPVLYWWTGAPDAHGREE